MNEVVSISSVILYIAGTIIYCGSIYENEESIYDLDSIYDEYKISRVCLMIIVFVFV